MNEKQAHIEKVFHEALACSDPTARAMCLESACREDKALRAEVEALIACYSEADDFLEISAIAPANSPEFSTPSEGPGSIIGRYKLLEKIGEGGMAVVYMAEQETPMRRKVALKLVKLGMDSEQVIARFEAERQALALMDHSNIARVFDAGTTQSGRPYFVMELVKGVSITKFCDKNHLSTQDRLDLFVGVCHAVQHAHQKGVIHRDIKPSNVMVTLHDGRPMPKVIDFGIAKATNQRLTDKTLFTHYAQIIGTPEYMSPEQAEMSDQDVDTRTDVYSLGVLLYELLTGVPPLDGPYLRGKSYAEIQRIIREEEPVRPSTKISTLGEALIEIADLRCTSPDILRNLMCADLDWIVMKTLEKDRNQRYNSVSEFTADIERHLNHEPVLAGPPSAWYCFKKYVQRHRALITTLVAVGVTLLTGLCVSTYLLVRVKLAMNEVVTLESRVEADSRLSNVQRLYAEGGYQAALQEIEIALKIQDLGPAAYLMKAQLLLEMAQFDQAENELHKLTQAEPEIAGAAHYLLTRLYLATDSTKADEHRPLAEAMLPQTAEAFYLRSMTVASADEALPLLSEAIELDPRHYAACKARAFAYLNLKMYRKMAEDVRAIIVMRPHDYLGYALRAIVRRETGQPTAALRDHTQAIEFCRFPAALPKLYDQRRETHMQSGHYQAALEDAEQIVVLAPESSRFPVFCALMALEEYERAQDEYKRDRWISAAGYVFHLLRAEQPLVLPPHIASQSPFCFMQEAADVFNLLKEKAMLLPIHDDVWLGDWSPNGRQIAYARFSAFSWQPGLMEGGTTKSRSGGAHGIEILDLESGKTRRLTRFGMHPVWSPDAKHIAFTQSGDVWLVSANGGKSRKLASGGWRTQWSQDSKRVFFRAKQGGAVCSINIDLPDAEPVPVLSYPGHWRGAYSISPDERLIAIEESSEIYLLTFPQGKEVTRWKIPWPLESWMSQLQWEPRGKTILLDSFSHYDQSSLCLFNIEEPEPIHVFNTIKPWCTKTMLSPDGSKLIISAYGSTTELWLMDIDTSESLAEALAPTLTGKEFLAWRLAQWDQQIGATALFTRDTIRRAMVYLAAKDYQRAEHDIHHCVTLIKDINDPAFSAIQYWVSKYVKKGLCPEAEVLVRQNAQLAEKFPEFFLNRNQQEHPYRQLAEIYRAKGDVLAMETWLRKYADTNATR